MLNESRITIHPDNSSIFSQPKSLNSSVFKSARTEFKKESEDMKKLKKLKELIHEIKDINFN